MAGKVHLDSDDGLPRECVANLDTITSIPKDTLRERLVDLSPDKLAQLDSIRFALGLE